MTTLLRLCLLAALLVVLVLPARFITTFSQVDDEQDRIVETLTFSDEPVKITEVKAKKGLLRVGQKFKDTNDWFKGLTLKIKNTSDKPVNYVSALVTFTRPKEQKDAGRIPFGEPLIYGISPVELKKIASSNPAPSIPPGESIELSLPEKYFDEYKAILKRLDFPDSIKRIEVSLQEVGFEGGLLWSGGEYWRQDSNNPDKFIPLSKEKKTLLFF